MLKPGLLQESLHNCVEKVTKLRDKILLRNFSRSFKNDLLGLLKKNTQNELILAIK
jgi:hypothetical protein